MMSVCVSGGGYVHRSAVACEARGIRFWGSWVAGEYEVPCVCVLGIELGASGRAAYGLNSEPCLQLCDYYIKMQSYNKFLG